VYILLCVRVTATVRVYTIIIIIIIYTYTVALLFVYNKYYMGFRKRLPIFRPAAETLWHRDCCDTSAGRVLLYTTARTVLYTCKKKQCPYLIDVRAVTITV